MLESGPLPELARQNLELARYHMGVFNQISPFTFRQDLDTDAGHLRVQYRRQGRTVVEELTGYNPNIGSNRNWQLMDRKQ